MRQFKKATKHFKKFLNHATKWAKKHKLITAAALLVIIDCIGAAILLWPTPKMTVAAAVATKPAPVQVAKIVTVADTCANNNQINKYDCYKTELNNIIMKYNPESATALLEKQYNKVPYVKSQCHQLMHIIGRQSLIKYKDDLGETYTHGNQFCAGGYYHGASEEVVTQKGADYMANHANSICAAFAAENAYGINHFNCVHGLGHGFMEALDGDLPNSLKDCDLLDGDWQPNSCYGGVFMQNIMIAESPDESDNGTSKFLKTDDLMYPCDIVEEQYKTSCFLMQTSWMLPQVNYDYVKVFGLCATVDDQALKDTCYQSLGRDASGLQVYDLAKTEKLCMLGADSDATSNCVIGAVKDIVYHYDSDQQGYGFCKLLDNSLQGICSSTVRSYYATF